MFHRSRRLAALFATALILSLLAAPTAFAGDDDDSDDGPAVYQVTVTNLTSGQAFTPPLLATHRRNFHVFEAGHQASFGVKEVAENGNVPALVDELNGKKRVTAVVVAAGDPPPLLPGASISAEISAEGGAKFFSFVSMLICTNDGFAGLDGVRLPKRLGKSLEVYANSYDAGSEINSEDFNDIVPPCPALSGVATDKPGAGMSNPALAENGVITMHGGVVGGVDLTTAVHGWVEPVAKIVITRVR